MMDGRKRGGIEEREQEREPGGVLRLEAISAYSS